MPHDNSNSKQSTETSVEHSGLDISLQAQAKSEILSHIKHNLRTPINHIIGYCEILLEDSFCQIESLPAKFRDDLQKIHYSGQQLLLHVDDIFKPLQYHNESHAAESAHHEIRSHLNNVVGYCELLLEELLSSPQHLLLDDLQKVYSASKHFAQLIGQVPFWSEQEFLALSDAQNDEAEEEGDVIIPAFPEYASTAIFQNAGGMSPLVLVVDDDKNNRDMLSRRLEHLGCRTKTASNGLEALEKIRAQQFDLVLLDVMMPVLDGYHTLEIIKSDEAIRDLSVIMISALDQSAVVSACIEMGAEDYMPKSFDPAILKARIGASLARKRLRLAELQMMEYLQRELETASQIQANMLPSRFPLFPKCPRIDLHATMVPAKMVGGDFYDAFFVQSNLLFVCVGDVSGKGIPAALFMVQSMTQLRMQAMRVLSIDEIVSEVNTMLCMNNEAGMFVTLFCGILNIDTGDFVYANAGHIPPLLDKGDGLVEFIPLPRGPIAGIIEDAPYNAARLTLKPGETLLLYTDGVTEALNHQQHCYSDQRLRRKMSAACATDAKAMIEAVKADVEDFVEGAEQSDDITMLALHFLGGEGKPCCP